MKTYSYNHFLFFCFILGTFLLGLLNPAYALSVITTKEIDANLPNGAIESRVVLGKRVFKVEAHGFYFRNNATNSIDIEITGLLRDNQSFPLTSSAKTSLKIPPSAKIKKSTILVLKGENAEEVAKILGISKEEYQKLENITQTKAANDPMYANTPFSNGSDSSAYDNNLNSPNNNAINGKDGANGSNGYGVNGNDGVNGNNGSHSNNNAIGSGIDTDGVLGVDGVNGSSSSSGGSVGGYENNFTNHGSTNNNTGGYDNFNNNSSSGGSLGNGGLFPIPFGNGDTNNSNNPTNTTSPTNGSSSNSATNPSSQENNYSSQYCKAPELSPNNTMKLDVIAKDGSCISMNALRDDTKCAYRYDFEAGKAIKQTQYYYVDRENKTQNIGGCVDLQGAQYAMQLYKDDSKCALQTTSDKGYGMGKTQTFQTEIVFRGMDNLIHVAVPCSDYARVQDRIVRYEKNDKTQTLTPIVDQYYNDPSNPNKQQILNRGIATQLSSQYQEFACGQWEYNDAKLEAKRPTMLKSYNKLNGEWVEVTPCNFEAGIKSGAVVSPYVMGVSSSKVLSDITTSHYFRIERKNYGEREQCQKPYGINRCQPQYFHTDPSITDWSATYKTTTTQTTQPYLRPAQDNESPTTYNLITTQTTINRTQSVLKNELHLSNDYLKYVEIYQGYYKDNDLKQSQGYIDWTNYYLNQNEGFCSQYSIWSENTKIGKNWYRWHNNKISCAQRLIYRPFQG
ncbi:competence protein [Helicobacter pylori]|uniref:competence protein n=1 Tax=Helicobacter pylori TaxID=210 RepID=UPI000BE9194E|nr:competence protein [Helicobacter pylori]PDW17172.1 competence protein [Helicobacter pylori]